MAAAVRKSTESKPDGSSIRFNEKLSFFDGESAKPNRQVQFPWKLHEMLEELEDQGYEEILSWLPHGRAFRVNSNSEEFVKKIRKLNSLKELPSF